MPRLEATLLDRFVNGAFAGKRKIGRPLKYNIRHKGHQGWIELCFNPRTRLEQYISEAMRFIHPYLFFVTYRFHVEKAREAGKFKLILPMLKRSFSLDLCLMHEVFESNGMRVRYLHANGIRNESTGAGTSPAALSSCFSPMVLIFIFIII